MGQSVGRIDSAHRRAGTADGRRCRRQRNRRAIAQLGSVYETCAWSSAKSADLPAWRERLTNRGTGARREQGADRTSRRVHQLRDRLARLVPATDLSREQVARAWKRPGWGACSDSSGEPASTCNRPPSDPPSDHQWVRRARSFRTAARRQLRVSGDRRTTAGRRSSLCQPSRSLPKSPDRGSRRSPHHHRSRGGNLDLASAVPGIRIFGSAGTPRDSGITDRRPTAMLAISRLARGARPFDSGAHERAHCLPLPDREGGLFQRYSLCRRLRSSVRGDAAQMMRSLDRLASLPNAPVCAATVHVEGPPVRRRTRAREPHAVSQARPCPRVAGSPRAHHPEHHRGGEADQSVSPNGQSGAGGVGTGPRSERAERRSRRLVRRRQGVEGSLLSR